MGRSSDRALTISSKRRENYRAINRCGWDRLAREGSDSSRPFGPSEFAHAHDLLDPERWLRRQRPGTVLCLAAGGGQQAPLFAWLGWTVAVVDLSHEQLELDRHVAAAYGLRLECIERDMLDLAPLYGRDFDLVYQPVSALYVPDVRRLYREVARVLHPGGLYRVEHWNPTQMQMAEDAPWDGSAYRLEYQQGTGRPFTWPARRDATSAVCLHFIHPLRHMLGGLCAAGFEIVRFGERSISSPTREPGSPSHLSTFAPTFLTVLARLSREPSLPG